MTVSTVLFSVLAAPTPPSASSRAAVQAQGGRAEDVVRGCGWRT